MAFTLSSPAFKQGDLIPAQYTCDGSDLSPPLEWKNAPPATKSFALIMEDPDASAGVWDHWIVFNIPVDVHALAEGIQRLPVGAQALMNSWKHDSYNGPCPPRLHHYIFKLYALDNLLTLKPNATKAELQAAIKNHLLDVATYTGEYVRVKR